MSNPTALISDIHGNSPALHAVLEDIRQFDCEQIFVIGDVINGLDPAGCVDLLLETPNVTTIKGNAEFYILMPDVDQFPKQDDPFYKDMLGLCRWWIERLGSSRMAWLQTWADFIVWNGWLLVHDSPQGRIYPQTRYVPGVEEKYQELFYHNKGLYEGMDNAALEKLSIFMDEQRVSGVFVGHTHKPFLKALGKKFVCNTGSVGMPLDGDPRPVWVRVEGAGNITIHRIEYDIAEAHVLVDNTPDYFDFKVPGRAEAFKKMYQTGIYWGIHMRKG
ncbi:MAG: metallophosphoesterase family protein [Anaerolineales bacterium]